MVLMNNYILKDGLSLADDSRLITSPRRELILFFFYQVMEYFKSGLTC